MHLRRFMRVDAAIVGGGPAGLSAALVLGRCRRNVVMFDDGNYRNRDAHVVRGFLTRDHVRTSPGDLRAFAHADLEKYPSVRIVEQTVVDVRRSEDEFALLTATGAEYRSRAVLFATGYRDTLPSIGGARELHGDLVVPCPYCDAWEVRDQPLAAYAHPDDRGAAFARVLSRWSKDIVLCAERRPQISDEQRAKLAARGVRVEHRELRSVERDGEGIRLIFSEGESLWRRMLFYHLGGGPASNLPMRLGTDATRHGNVVVDRKQEASLPGVFVAGDATRDVLQAIVAAGEGAAAGVTINEYLCERD